jgi:hypothetical protein
MKKYFQPINSGSPKQQRVNEGTTTMRFNKVSMPSMTPMDFEEPNADIDAEMAEESAWMIVS